MKSLLKKSRTAFMFGKQYMHRTLTYAGLLNSGMIFYLFLVAVKERGYISFDVDKYFIPLVIIGFVILFILGWIEMEYIKGFQEESAISFAYTPQLVRMHEQINYLWEKEKAKELNPRKASIST